MPVTTFAKVRGTRSFPGVYFEININLSHGKGSSLSINYLQCGYIFVKLTHVIYIYIYRVETFYQNLERFVLSYMPFKIKNFNKLSKKK